MLVALGAGCSDEGRSPTEPSAIASQLLGTWTLTSLQPTGQASQVTPLGAVYNLSFSNGQLSARTDCNTCGGSFSLNGQTLVAGPALACTRAACPTMAFETVYTALLSGESSASIVDRALTLTSTRGVLRFSR